MREAVTLEARSIARDCGCVVEEAMIAIKYCQHNDLGLDPSADGKKIIAAYRSRERERTGASPGHWAKCVRYEFDVTLEEAQSAIDYCEKLGLVGTGLYDLDPTMSLDAERILKIYRDSHEGE